MRHAGLMCGVLATACCGLAAQSVPTRPLPILARDVDKRPLPKVTAAELSPAMRQKVQSLVDEARANEAPEDKNRATPPSLVTTIYRIPVAPSGHRVYLVEQSGELACSGTGVNCEEDVFDETPDGVTAVTTGQVRDISVVRRLNLQMPDIAVYDQLGHFAMDITVYRFNGSEWHPYLCKEIDPINDDPNPAVIADKPCK